MAYGYSYDEDAKELTVNIRKDAKFSNGDPVTADDVIFSFQQNCAISGNRTPSVDFDNAYAPDENTVVLPVEPYNDTVIDGLCALGVCSRSWTEDFTNEDHIYVDILESGPYCLQDGWKSGDVMVFEKNPYYWDVDGLVYDRIEVSCIAEENTRYLSFTTDELDVCYLTDSGNVDTIAADSNYQLVQYPYQSITCLMFDTEYTDMFPNEEIRLAICYAVDVETIVETLCGSAYVPATSMLSSSNWAYKDETYGYDPELAKKYYEESGLKDFTFTLQLQDATMDSNIAEAIQGYLAEIGITMNIETYDTPTFFQHLMNQELFCMFSQYSGITDPGTLLNQWISTSPSVAAHTPVSYTHLTASL